MDSCCGRSSSVGYETSVCHGLYDSLFDHMASYEHMTDLPSGSIEGREGKKGGEGQERLLKSLFFSDISNRGES